MRSLLIKKNEYGMIVKEAAKVICNGGVIVLPFDTVYGVVCDASDNNAVKKIYNIKNRDLGKPIGVALDKIERLSEIALPTQGALRFIKERTPGPFTFILPAARSIEISDYCKSDGFIGVRIPDSDLVRNIVRESGKVVAQTSANLAGKPNIKSIEELRSQLSAEKLNQIDLIIDGGEIQNPKASEIIDLTAPGEIKRVERS